MRSALRTICRQAFRGFACKVPAFPDLPCPPPDPKCFYVPDGNCKSAEEVLARELPREKFLEKMEKHEARCCVLRSIAKNPCTPMTRPKKVKEKPEKPFRSMWEPPCETEEQPFCKDMLPRFDAMYYNPCYPRCYQRTWVECPPVKQRLKKVCCLDGIKPPEVLYRNTDPCLKTCGLPLKELGPPCEEVDWERDPCGKCPKKSSPCCKPPRCNPHCRRSRKLSQCTKLRAPYPSFSEKRPWVRPLRKRECNCLEKLPQCIIIREEKKRDRDIRK
ncbi:uncharacterized protein LOC108090371 [Drosophila ficusphila]|uniref:uncharacterized protein LOC108090371 n=1 Tax=Drosophila ficusphila TaxID=30025 RepID=UPI0007E88256|nr:uncharacterized protein LOC108090371 [Drosophila ficusphila]